MNSPQDLRPSTFGSLILATDRVKAVRSGCEHGLVVFCGPVGSVKSSVADVVFLEMFDRTKERPAVIAAEVRLPFSRANHLALFTAADSSGQLEVLRHLRAERPGALLFCPELSGSGEALNAITEMVQAGTTVFCNVHANDVNGLISRLRSWGVLEGARFPVTAISCTLMSGSRGHVHVVGYRLNAEEIGTSGNGFLAEVEHKKFLIDRGFLKGGDFLPLKLSSLQHDPML